MVYVVEKAFDVSFDKPLCACKTFLHLSQRRVTASVRTEAVGRILKLPFIYRLQKHPYVVLKQLVLKGWNTQRSELCRVAFLRDVGTSHGSRVIGFVAEGRDQRVDPGEAHAVRRVFVYSLCQRSVVFRYIPVCGEIQFGVVQIAVQIFVSVIFLRIVRTQTFQ